MCYFNPMQSASKCSCEPSRATRPWQGMKRDERTGEYDRKGGNVANLRAYEMLNRTLGSVYKTSVVHTYIHKSCSAPFRIKTRPTVHFSVNTELVNNVINMVVIISSRHPQARGEINDSLNYCRKCIEFKNIVPQNYVQLLESSGIARQLPSRSVYGRRYAYAVNRIFL